MTAWVVMASGPSMCQDDADYCRGKAGVIVVNSTYRMAPWADLVYSNDHDWYEANISKMLEDCSGHFICGHPTWRHPDVQSMPFVREAPGLLTDGRIAWGMNSGGAALNLAYTLAPDKIILLGYDQQWAGNSPRWHGRHPEHLQNQKPGFHRWAVWFEQAARDFKRLGIPVFNCSRKTSLTCFERRPLREVLC